MITGAHTIIYSRNADADRAAGEDSHELYLMTDDVGALIASMQARGVACDPPAQQSWGLSTSVAMPGGSKLGIYEPRHARPPVHAPKASKKAAAPKAKKKAAPKAKAKAKKPATKKKKSR